MKKLTFLKYVFFILILLIFYLVLKNPTQQIYKINIIGESHSYNLVDDFNGQLNKKYWNNIEQGNNYNNALQYYNPKNVNIKDGFLELEARKELFKDHQYTSGMITTKDKFEFLYGRIIFKAKPAIGDGLLSAIWLLPADDSLFPEVDMMEALGNSNENQIWTGVHYKDPLGLLNKNFTNNLNDNDFSIYEIEWNEKEIKGYINKKLVYKTDVGVPNKEMYLLIDLAVGGNWPGTPDEKALPAKLLIDYIVIIPKEQNTP